MQGISNERWAQVQRVLDQALALPADHVPSFLDRECAGDDELRREVAELLDSCGRAASFLEDPPMRLAAALVTEHPPTPAGRRIGPYVVIGEAGRGGMGVVYVA